MEQARVQAGQQGALHVEALLSAVAAPAAQLWLQGDLIERGTAVSARDVWVVAQRLLQTLNAHGLEISAPIGSEVSFDPNYHQALSGVCTPGTPVRVRLPGLSYRGRVLVKAGVETLA